MSEKNEKTLSSCLHETKELSSLMSSPNVANVVCSSCLQQILAKLRRVENDLFRLLEEEKLKPNFSRSEP